MFRWGRLIFCWYERLMDASARRVSITVMTCIGRDTLMGHFCTTRDDAAMLRDDVAPSHIASPGRSVGRPVGRPSSSVRPRLGPTRARWIRARWGASSSSSDADDADERDDDERDDDAGRRRRARAEASTTTARTASRASAGARGGGRRRRFIASSRRRRGTRRWRAFGRGRARGTGRRE